jgi:transposase
MSTSLLYHAFGARTYRYLKTEYRGGAIYFHLIKRHHECADCGHHAVGLDLARSYPLLTIPIGGKPVFLVVNLYTLICMNCGSRLQESRDIADPRKSYTRAFTRLVLDLSKKMTMLDIARHLHVGWDLVKGIIKESLERRAKRRKWKHVRRIAIDEIAIRKGHNYMTVVVDLDSGQALYTAEGRDHSCLKGFFRKLRRCRAKLEAIAVDMSSAYLKAIKLYAPKNVAIVHDRYHVVAKMNEVVDKVRRDEQNRLDDEGKKVLKGSRYILLYGKEKLDKQPEKRARLDTLLEANELLHKVYIIKEDLRMFWAQETKEKAKEFIHTWCVEVRSLANRHVTTMANTIEKRLEYILAWYDHPITTGPLEGLNNKIKVLKRSAYGYRDQGFFGLRILFLHESKFKLAGA